MTNVNNSIDVRKINELLRTSKNELISLSENKYLTQLEAVTQSVYDKKEQCSMLLVSGPSASTKTTTTNKIADILKNKGVKSVVVSLDDFFLNREDLPLLETGETDFETINTLDFKTLDRCFEELLNNNISEFPIFDFKLGRRSNKTRTVTLDKDTILLIEGIHALNSKITGGHDESKFLKLYVSPDSDYYYDSELILSSRDLRFVRRAVRDYFHRGSPIEATMQMWVNVVKSETVNIIPFRAEADFTIDTTIMYEPCVYEYDLARISKSDPKISEKNKEHLSKILKSLARFYELEDKNVPKDSALWEFLNR